MKVVTYIAQFLKSKGIDTVFELQGGMITRIIDELYQQGGVTIVSVHHEQAAAMAADAYARVKNIPGVALATSGPGATNLITGIGNCYFDSVPAIFITGQVNLNEQKGDRPIRQLGFQETDIVSIAKPITKAAYAIKTAEEIPFVLEEAYKLSMEGRPGPVLIDIPMNLQNADCSDFHSFIQKPDFDINQQEMTNFISNFTKSLSGSKKPLILAGRGVRTGNAISELLKLGQITNIPIVTSLNGLDVIPFDSPNRIGFIGSYGNRWANYAMGTCDLLLVVGSRLDLRQTGADIDSFSTGKKIFHVDIEKGELQNRITDCEILHADVFSFLKKLLEIEILSLQFDKWYAELNDKMQQRSDTAELTGIDGINPNKFIHTLSQQSKLAKAYSTDVGSNQMWVAQSIELYGDQVFLTSGGMGAMGYSLPAAIGGCFALNKAPVVCIAGDGGFQINIQELQTIRRNNLPIKIVVINNHCLGMIRQFQDSYFDSNYASTVWGYSAPNFVAVANAYGISASSIEKEEQISVALEQMWKDPNEPYLLEVSVDIHTNVYPKMLFGNPITNMEPMID
jgi:acetolactate synthase I/II/III large subunit